MDKLIQFRALVDKLNAKEYELLWLKLLPMISTKECISTILFHHFKELHSKNQYEQVQNLNKTLLEILNDRKKQNISLPSPDAISTDPTAKEEEPKYIGFDDVPNELISEITTFFSFKDYLKFQTINRRTFIICKSPIKFIELNAPFCKERHDYCFTSYLSKYIEDCHSNQPITNYFNFKNIKSLSIDLDHFSVYKYPNVSYNTFQSLENLAIDCSGTKRSPTWYFHAKPMLQSLFKDNKVKRLFLTNDIDSEILPGIVCELIPQFPYLESLQIGQWDQNDDINIDSWSDDDILTIFSNLKTLSLFMDATYATDRIVKVIGHQLEHVVIDYGAHTAFSQGGWGNLLELELADASQIAVDNIAKTAQNIQKMSISLNETTYSVHKNVKLDQLIKQQKKLKYLCVRGCGANGLSQGVMSLLSLLNVTSFKIRLDLFDEFDGWEEATMVQCIENIINTLKKATKNNFMLIMHAKFKLPEIERFVMDACVGRLDYSEMMKDYYLMIRSNEYQMYGGYHETWMNWQNYFLH